MKTLRLSVIASVVALLSTLCAHAQIAGSGTKHFEKYGLEFDYPSTWTITEGGSEQLQYVELSADDKSTQLIVNWQFDPVLSCEAAATRKTISQALADRVATRINSPARETSWQKMQLGKMDTDQIQLRGLVSGVPLIADVYSLTVKDYFLNLVYLRVANDKVEDSAWKTIRASLKVSELSPAAYKPISGGVLNSKAIRLPKPEYPAAAKEEYASGMVVIEVLIDEQGNVYSACAIKGHRTLLKASMQSARVAKFTPEKLDGKPVRVHGVITYNFVARSF